MVNGINPFNQYAKQLSFGQGQRQVPRTNNLEAAAASSAAFAAGAQRLQPTLPVLPTAQAQGTQALGANKFQGGDDFTRFLSDRAKSQHHLGNPRAAEGLGKYLDLKV